MVSHGCALLRSANGYVFSTDEVEIIQPVMGNN